LDSIPAVFAIVTDSRNKELIIYTSNIFAVLGLRSLFFLLKGAVTKFEYLQQGIAIVLVFIGLKMLAEIVHVKVPVYISLLVIVICLVGSIVYSMQVAGRRLHHDKEP
jgi:tellurite resistance protein TerC